MAKARSKTSRLIPAVVAAEESGISYTSLKDCVYRGELPAVRVGGGGVRRGAIYIDRADLARFIESHKETNRD
jgi:hypothetical protein